MSVPERPAEAGPARVTRTVRLVPQVVAVVVVAVGAMVLAGWALRLPLLTKIAPSLPAMTPNTAVAFVLAGMALWLLGPRGAGGWRRLVGRGLALLVVLLGAVVLAEYLAGWRPGLDLWLFRGEVVGVATRYPGRPSPHTAVAFVLVGLALALLDADRRRGRPGLVLAPLSAAVALVALLGYVYQVRYLYGVSTGTGMALHTAITFVLLNTGLLACRPDRQPTRTFLAPGPAGLLARRLVPALLLAPLAVGGLMVLGQRNRLFGPAFGIALATVAMLAALIVVVVVTARDLERLEDRRRAFQDDLLEGEKRLRRDITRRHRAERALREHEATLRAVISASPDLIMFLGPDGHIRFVSSAMQRILGFAAEEQVNEDAFNSEQVHPDDKTAFVQAQRRVLSGQDEQAMVRLRVRHADGHWVLLEAHTRPLDADGGSVIVARDVTERGALEEDLRQAKLHAEQANQAKSEYLSRMSHELRTPLNAILGFAQLLEMDELAGEQRDSLRHILSGARHLLELINEVLDIAAIEAGRLSLSLEPVAAADVIAEAVSLIRPLADQRGILLADGRQVCDGHVLGDRQRLRQILLNLLSNAVKYNREGGSVQLACQPVAGERLRISVTDTGPGIAPGALDLLFVPFERLGSEDSGIEGSGLGLPLSKRLADAMGGSLEMTTAPGRGCTFWVELPLVKGAERQHDGCQPGQERPSRPGPVLTLLCIEGNPSNLQLIERVLSRRPAVKLISAMQPQLGLELADEHRPDVVMLDLHLPDMPGEQVLDRLRANPRTADVPVVILTADARPDLTRRLLDQGARALLTKPLDVRELLALLDAIATEQEPASAAGS